MNTEQAEQAHQNLLATIDSFREMFQDKFY